MGAPRFFGTHLVRPYTRWISGTARSGYGNGNLWDRP